MQQNADVDVGHPQVKLNHKEENFVKSILDMCLLDVHVTRLCNLVALPVVVNRAATHTALQRRRKQVLVERRHQGQDMSCSNIALAPKGGSTC